MRYIIFSLKAFAQWKQGVRWVVFVIVGGGGSRHVKNEEIAILPYHDPLSRSREGGTLINSAIELALVKLYSYQFL